MCADSNSAYPPPANSTTTHSRLVANSEMCIVVQRPQSLGVEAGFGCSQGFSGALKHWQTLNSPKHIEYGF